MVSITIALSPAEYRLLCELMQESFKVHNTVWEDAIKLAQANPDNSILIEARQEALARRNAVMNLAHTLDVPNLKS